MYYVTYIDHYGHIQFSEHEEEGLLLLLEKDHWGRGWGSTRDFGQRLKNGRLIENSIASPDLPKLFIVEGKLVQPKPLTPVIKWSFN